ncbi:GMC oxidoreductase [Trametopsis cervina]|nr:GMC oxidoreductase [Trametopsis cervina]
MDALQKVLSVSRRKDPRVLGASVASLAALYLVLKWASSTQAKPKSKLEDDLRQVDEKEYDVIIVGGGTAGCVIASRLSEDPSINVLLLEAGHSGKKNPQTIIPSAYGRYFLTKHDWSLYTEPQKHAANRKNYWPRAKILGGCESLCPFHYGAPSDYDEWAAIQKDQPGADEWSYTQFHPYFKKFEKFSPSQAWPEVDVTLRGAEGLVKVGYGGYFGPYAKDFVDSCVAGGLAHSHDVNTHKGTLGVTRVMTYIDKGRRVTAENAYLTREVLARRNLTVAVGAFVNRVLFDSSSGTPRATGVEFRNEAGRTFTVKARKEVVLSAGAIHTPHILMLSGVGPADHLASVEVPLVKDLPGVGSHLKDHAVIDVIYANKKRDTNDFYRPKTFGHTIQFFKYVAQYELHGTGPFTSNLAEAAAFLRSDDPIVFPPAQYPKESAPEDTTTGKGAPDMEFFVSCLGYKDSGTVPFENPTGYTFALHAVCLRPKSSGTIRLQSNKPQDQPLIDPHYLEDSNDLKLLVRGVRLIDQISKKKPIADRIDHSQDNCPSFHHDFSDKTDEEVAQFVRENLDTLYHPACTARMAPLEDGGVVDPHLRVYGISNLRIADASVFPSIIAGHTTAPVYAIAEKASDLIKKELSKA